MPLVPHEASLAAEGRLIQNGGTGLVAGPLSHEVIENLIASQRELVALCRAIATHGATRERHE